MGKATSESCEGYRPYRITLGVVTCVLMLVACSLVGCQDADPDENCKVCGNIPLANFSGGDCVCPAGYVDTLTKCSEKWKGSCTAAPCSIPHTNGVAGNCKCSEKGYAGNISWSSSSISQSYVGACGKTECNAVANAVGPFPDCKCADGFAGTVSWDTLAGTWVGSCHPVPCTSAHSNREAGPSCKCLEGYAGEITWHGSIPSGACSEVGCDTFPHGTGTNGSCRCRDGYEGAATFVRGNSWNAKWTGTCMPAECSVENSNQMPGLQCRCLEHHTGEVLWSGASAFGSCTPAACTVIDNAVGPFDNCTCRDGFFGDLSFDPLFNSGTWTGSCHEAPCNVSHSNYRPGPQCECGVGYAGGISWNGPNASGPCTQISCSSILNSMGADANCMCSTGFTGDATWAGGQWHGACLPAPCTIPGSNQLPGLHCSCASGYVGVIGWSGSTPAGLCAEAACAAVPNATGSLGQCRCADGFVGEVAWVSGSWTGVCSPAPCTIVGSNQEPGLQCHCHLGYAGEIHWDESIASGTCSPVLCSTVANAVGHHDACHCDEGYFGELSFRSGAWSGRCSPAPCNITYSNYEPGPDCRCITGYAGSIHWNGSTPSGLCSPVPCDTIEHAIGSPSGGCRCDNGYNGSISFADSMWKGACRPAHCNINNTNGLPGVACKCGDGFTGDVAWAGDQAVGKCRPAECGVRHAQQSWSKPGSCECEYGFTGTVTFVGDVGSGSCDPAPCLILNSNGAAGPQCACQDAFTGSTLTFSNGAWRGSCDPAPCEIPNSNGRPGLGCGCADAYEGSITWNAGQAFGTCDPAPCSIPNSNLRMGPACACLMGYIGDITWEHGVAAGTCVAATCPGGMTNGIDGPACECAFWHTGLVWSDGWEGRCQLPTQVVLPSAASCGILFKYLLKILFALLARRYHPKEPRKAAKKDSRASETTEKTDEKRPTQTGTLTKDARTICLVGMSGYGKSTLGNILADADDFVADDGKESVTRWCAFKEFTYEGQMYRVIDTPGIEDTHLSASEIIKRITGFAHCAPQGIDAFLFVFRGKDRFMKHDDQSLKAFENACSKKAFEHTALVFTFSGDIEEERKRIRTAQNKSDRFNDCLRNVNDRVCPVELGNPAGKTQARKDVMAMVEQIRENRARARYSEKTLEGARKFQSRFLDKVAGLSDSKNKKRCEDALEELVAGRKKEQEVNLLYEECRSTEADDREKSIRIEELVNLQEDASVVNDVSNALGCGAMMLVFSFEVVILALSLFFVIALEKSLACFAAVPASGCFTFLFWFLLYWIGKDNKGPETGGPSCKSARKTYSSCKLGLQMGSLAAVDVCAICLLVVAWMQYDGDEPSILLSLGFFVLWLFYKLAICFTIYRKMRTYNKCFGGSVLPAMLVGFEPLAARNFDKLLIVLKKIYRVVDDLERAVQGHGNREEDLDDDVDEEDLELEAHRDDSADITTFWTALDRFRTAFTTL